MRTGGNSVEAVQRVDLPLTPQKVRELQAGTPVRLFGEILTARDAAHRRMVQALSRGEELPVLLKNTLIYYTGPCPARKGEVIGAAGPTTSSRMDTYTPRLLAEGLLGMMGKGDRSPAVIEAMKEYGAVYLAAPGGAGALLAGKITRAAAVAYEDLGPEAVFRLEVADFPAVVAIDIFGNNLYRRGRRKYARSGG